MALCAWLGRLALRALGLQALARPPSPLTRGEKKLPGNRAVLVHVSPFWHHLDEIDFCCWRPFSHPPPLADPACRPRTAPLAPGPVARPPPSSSRRLLRIP